MIPQPKILIVDDEPLMRIPLTHRLKLEGYAVTAVGTGEDAVSVLSAEDFEVAVIDLRLPGIDGLEVLRRIRELGCPLDSIVITAHGTIETAVEAMKLGARDFLTKPFATEQLLEMVRRYVRGRQAGIHEPGEAEGGQAQIGGIVGRSAPMREVFRLIEIAADSNATIIVRGETGTGKELVAAAIHSLSRRRDRPFVKVNCASIPEPLFESEVFGVERGAFTGADRRRLGRFEVASGGTLLLDEVDEMPLGPQAKVLRVVQEREVDRLGGVQSVKLDVRLLATTKVDLLTRVAEGRFREDLYYRLNVFPIVLPALRERGDDVALLATHFLHQLARENHRPALSLSPAAVESVRAHGWPGNVRELRNAMERAVMLCTTDLVEPRHLPFDAPAPSTPACASPVSLATTVVEAENRRILEALTATGGHKGKAAELLGISRKTLWEKLNRRGRSDH